MFFDSAVPLVHEAIMVFEAIELSNQSLLTKSARARVVGRVAYTFATTTLEIHRVNCWYIGGAVEFVGVIEREWRTSLGVDLVADLDRRRTRFLDNCACNNHSFENESVID